MKKTIMAAAVAAMGMMSAGAANAVPVNSSNWGDCLGDDSCVVNGTTLTAGGTGAKFTTSNYRGFVGLGVDSSNDTGGDRGNEIEGLSGGSESITLEFANSFSQGFNIVLRHFYNPEEFGNDPKEQANIEAFDDDDTSLGTFTLLNESNSVLTKSGFGSVGATLIRTSTAGDDPGEVAIRSLFAGYDVSKLVFTAGPNATARDLSDYTLRSVSAVPLPAAAWLLLGGLGAMGLVGRKRKAA